MSLDSRTKYDFLSVTVYHEDFTPVQLRCRLFRRHSRKFVIFGEQISRTVVLFKDASVISRIEVVCKRCGRTYVSCASRGLGRRLRMHRRHWTARLRGRGVQLQKERSRFPADTCVHAVANIDIAINHVRDFKVSISNAAAVTFTLARRSTRVLMIDLCQGPKKATSKAAGTLI